MLSQWNSASDKVLVTTYKVATVLEVIIDTTVRNDRKQRALQALTDLLTKEEEEEPGKQSQDETHNHEKNGKNHHAPKHEKKHKKKKHRS